MNLTQTTDVHHNVWQRLSHWRRHGHSPWPLTRPLLSQLASQSPDSLPKAVRHDPLCQHYLALLGPLPWHQWQHRLPGKAYPGPAAQSMVPFVAAYLVKLDVGLKSMCALRRFLVNHPALVWLLGFPLQASTHFPWGFDPYASVPSPIRFTRVLRQLENDALQFLLDDSIAAIRSYLPQGTPLGQVVSLDTKHIIAWLKENNPKAYVKEGRFDKTQQPAGDPDCKLGCKRRHNRIVTTPAQGGKPASSVPIAIGEYYWGYASGVVATKLPGYGEFVLAELTQTFDCGDTTYFFPLMEQVERRLGFRPQYGAFDAAYDAFYVYDYFHNEQLPGFAAVPFAEKGGRPTRLFAPDGLPLCDAGLPMPLKFTYQDRTTSILPYERAKHGCPRQKEGDICPVAHSKWAKGGCSTSLANTPGARIRHQLDRDSATYKAIYNQRTAVERIFAQAVDLGIERPKLRNQVAISNMNTLTYLLINLRGVARLRQSSSAA